jgi:hypothetical protein
MDFWGVSVLSAMTLFGVGCLRWGVSGLASPEDWGMGERGSRNTLGMGKNGMREVTMKMGKKSGGL